MLTRFVVVLALLAGGAACGDSSGDESLPRPSLNPATAMIDTDDGIVLVNTEVADSPQERARGLMGRKSLGEDEGMMFLYFEEHRGPYTMRNTLIPLSIAFFDRTGEIISILDMEPCEEEPCPLYDSGKAYWGALEVNQGAFEDWGVELGDRIRSNQ